jgi:hypothetical protein
MSRISTQKLSSAILDKTLANNGLTELGDTVQLGGALTKATTITTSGTNTLAIAGLQSGASTDSILVANPTTGVLRRRSVSSVVGSSGLSNNGLSKSGDTVQLGGALTKATVIATSATNTIALSGLQSGASTDSVLVSNPSTGVVGRRSMSSVFPNGRVSCSTLNTSTKQLTIANSNIQTNSVVILQYEDPTGSIISTTLVSRVAGTSFTVQFASTPSTPATAFINYLIIN